MKTIARKTMVILCVCIVILFTVAVPTLADTNILQPGTPAVSFDETTVTTTLPPAVTTMTSTETAVMTSTATQVTTVFVESSASTAIPAYLWTTIIVIFLVLIALIILLLFRRKMKAGGTGNIQK